MKLVFLKLFVICGIIITFSSNVFASDLNTAGFSGDKIIYNNISFKLNDTVKLSVPVFNQTGGNIRGNVNLYVNDKSINKKPITLKNGEFSGVSFDYKITEAKSIVSIKFEDTTLEIPKLKKEIVFLANRELGSTIIIQGEKNEEGSLLKEYNVDETKKPDTTENSIDSYRQDFLYSAEDKIVSIKQDINESIKANQEYEARLSDLRKKLPKANGGLLTPVQYVYAWILSALAYILANAYLFYGILVLIAFLLIRFIIRKVNRNHQHHHGNK